ncbi:22809_t:CDS:1, partial [Gigaspora margarita]
KNEINQGNNEASKVVKKVAVMGHINKEIEFSLKNGPLMDCRAERDTTNRTKLDR